MPEQQLAMACSSHSQEAPAIKPMPLYPWIEVPDPWALPSIGFPTFATAFAPMPNGNGRQAMARSWPGHDQARAGRLMLMDPKQCV